MKTFALLLAALLTGTHPVQAAADEVSIAFDPAQTEIRFTLGDVLHTVHGTFKLKQGTVRIDRATGKASGEFVVDVASGTTGGSIRDKRMHKEILESARYPEAVFTPTRVEGQLAADGNSTVQVHGTLNIHGAPHEITLPVSVHTAGRQTTVDTHFTIPYELWGMKNPSNFLLKVSDKVEIDIHTVLK